LENGGSVMSIKLKFETYSIYINDDKGKKEYAELVERIESLGHIQNRCFTAIGGVTEIDFDEDQIIETDFLFENQFNTKSGKRLFDWREYYLPHRTRQDLKCGYFITEGLVELNAARMTQYACGYCGKRYEKPTQVFCDACLSSEYLTKDTLYMLALVPVAYNHDKADKMRKSLARDNPAQDWSEIQKKQEIARVERLKRKAAKKLEDLKIERKIKDYEIAVQIALLENGIDIENLIFYSHTGQWCLGWQEHITEKQLDEFRSAIEAVADKIPTDVNGISLLNILDFKIRAAV
jgi:hypothetical protein